MNNKQRGAASLIVVIFTVLVLSLIIVSFIHVMLSDQQQATANDLSQSAYDSAQVGVEDAKRAILRYQDICDTGSAPECNTAYSELISKNCNQANSRVVAGVTYNVNNPEIAVKTGNTSNKLNQAYTCVIITLDTFDYIGSLNKDENRLVPLISDSPFDTIKIEWFNLADLQDQGLGLNVGVPGNPTTLLTVSGWNGALSSPTSIPSIMRAQLIQYGLSGFNLSDLDSNNISAATSKGAFNSTMFLYPSNNGVNNISFPSSGRLTMSTGYPTQVTCNQTNISSGDGYACSITIKMPVTQPAGARNAYLNLESLYKGAHYRVSMANNSASSSCKGDGCVRFHAIQPEVDSTGRANDLYRRVDTRIGLGDTTFPYPKAAVDLTGNFCKTFYVTDTASDSDYGNNGTCAP